MSSLALDSLRRQFDLASDLVQIHLATLTTEECLWRPARRGLHVHHLENGLWQADWPETESYEIGPPSIAWVTWHLGFWWSMVFDHSFGAATLERSQVHWPGDAEAVRAWIADLKMKWLRAIGALSAEDLQSDALTRWPFEGRPFADVIAWANLELVKNAAEIGYARFLYAAIVRGQG